jgi:transposase
VKYVGIDLHKKTITICVVDKERKVLFRRTLHNNDPGKIRETFGSLGPFEAVVEATASYEWLFTLLKRFKAKLVLAHPGKLRVIAESVKKTDKLDAQVLAEFLALGMIPRAYRPTARQRQHRTLVRQRVRLQQRRTSVRNRIRYLLADYNADRQDLFTLEGLECLKAFPMSSADKFVRDQLLAEYDLLTRQISEMDERLKRFAKSAGRKEAEAREILKSIPGVGTVVSDVVIAELGDIDRFGSQKKVCAYAGLAPGRRESAQKAKDLPITKQGSRLLRWSLVESAWQLTKYSHRWQNIFEKLAHRRGRKRAIIAVARRLLGMMLAMLKAGKVYTVKPLSVDETEEPKPAGKAKKPKTSAAARQRRRQKSKPPTRTGVLSAVGAETEF